MMEYTNIINEAVDNNVHLDSIGQGTLKALLKPTKAKGPIANLRPITLLNGVRKLLSLVVLNRIKPKVNEYTGHEQAAYKEGRSTSDIVWTQRMMNSMVMTKKWRYFKMGIDMTQAFNTIKRKKLIAVMEEANFSEDDIKLVKYLLTNTRLQVKINKCASEWFLTNKEAFQGDAICGALFILGAMRHLRP